MLARIFRRLAPLAALAALVFVIGCDGTHLAGTNDVDLDYEVRETHRPAKPSAAEEARGPILTRLAAAHIAADVEPLDANHVRVTVDADSAPAVDDMLTWRGGLALYELDPAYAFAPADPKGLTAKTETTKSGAIERYFTGSRAAVVHAVNAGGVDAQHRVLLEAIDDSTVRTRVVKEPPALDLAEIVDLARGVDADRRDLVLYVKDGAKLQARVDALGQAPTVLALGRNVMAKAPIGELLVPERGSPPRAAIVIPMGATIYAYARAHNVKTLLSTGVLPPLARTADRKVPPNWIVAGACVVVPMILSLVWLVFVRRFDRSYPEPWWLVLATFALGGASVVPAGFLEWACMTVSPYLNPTLMTLGGKPSAFPIALAAFTLVVGLSEEGSKLLGAWTLAAHRREFDEPVDGIIYGAASSLGFAAVENIKYFAFGRLSASIVLARTFTSIPAHLFFGAIWGYALGKKLVSKRTSVLLFLAWAALMHGAFDTLLSIDGLQLAAIALNLALASLFIILLRRALRHGAVAPGASSEAPPSAHRAFFGVGNPPMFALSAVGLHVFALATMVYGIGHQAMHQKIGYAFLAGSSSLVACIGLCAYGLATTMPLDVAVDAEGITFAGRAIAWSAIRGARITPYGTRAHVRVATAGNEIALGPGPADRMQALLAMIQGYLARSRGP